MWTHVGSESEFLDAVDNMLNEMMSDRVIDFVVLHDQLPTNVTTRIYHYHCHCCRLHYKVAITLNAIINCHCMDWQLT